MADTLTKEQRSYCMSRIRSKGTKPEIILKKSLRRMGISYRSNIRNLPGTPDIVILEKKLAIFIDGDFWHGREFKRRSRNYNDYWTKKIKRNMERDKENVRDLKKAGWKVIRFWGSEIVKDCDKITRRIKKRLGA